MSQRYTTPVIADSCRTSWFWGRQRTRRTLTGLLMGLGGAVLAVVMAQSPTEIVHAKKAGSSNPVVPSLDRSIVPARKQERPSGVDKDWWSRVQRGLAQYEYRPSENGSGLQAPNRVHNLRTYFDASGIRVHDRTTESTELVGLSLHRLGRGTALQAVKGGTVHQLDTRVEIRRPGIIEWYENTAQGLEQGFTVASRREGDGPLVLELAVERATARLRGQSIELATDAGRRLQYGKLFVQDANGKTLVSHLEVPAPQRIRLVVEDAGAAYPLVIDPLLTGTADAILESNNPDDGSFDAAVFGGTVASAGDVDGDGIPDVIVGARGFDTPGLLFDEGAAFVFLGSLTGIEGSDPATAHAEILGDQAAAEFGTSVAGAGDVNGDGYDDIIVGAPFYEGTFRGDPTLSVKGAAFVFYGGPAGIVAIDPATAHARIDANQVDAILGSSVLRVVSLSKNGRASTLSPPVPGPSVIEERLGCLAWEHR